MKKIIHHILFGNYFYGLCALALTVEATLQQALHFLHPLYYIIIFLSSIFYYNEAYIHLNDPKSYNPRTRWYFHHAKTIKIIQSILFLGICISGIVYFNKISPQLKNILSHFNPQYLIILIFPVAGYLYYLNLRNVGWLKPILIGFTWSGVVTVLPVVVNSIENDIPLIFHLINILLFIKNMMFVIVLCILFDIKDYAADYNQSVKTFVVKYGLRNTLFYICLPLSILGLGTFIGYGIYRDFSSIKILFNTIPFVFLFIVAYSMRNRKSIFYYLFIIDGLMVLKGLCGSIAMYFFS